MDAARFSRVEDAFHQASELTGAARERALATICGDDHELRREVEELLAAAAHATPAFAGSAGLRFDSAVPADPAPRQIGPYRVLRRLGSGGFSVVYLAEEEGEGFRRQVAVKLLAGFPGERLLRRFAAETRILAGLEHPGIARFHTAGRAEDGTAYLVLEYIEGTDLLADCRERRATLAERLRLFTAILDAVDYAHRSLVVHRDLKPGNILVSLDGRPKLLDFGIAALLDPADGVALGETATLFRAFTPAYASPEQLRGERVTTASDVYSLGVVLYELLAGVRPHGGSSLQDELARGFRAVEPEPPSTAARRRPAEAGAPEARQLAGDLDAIVLKALRSDPAARYPSVSALAEDLRRFAAGLPVLARRPTLRYRTERFLRRHAAAVATAAGVALLAGTGLAWHVDRLQRERDRAHAAAEEARRETRKAERMVDLLSAIFQETNPVDQPGRPLTARELLERGGAKVDRGLAAEPETRAQLRTVLAGIWTEIGDTGRAAALLEPMVADLEKRLGRDHPATAQACKALGGVRHRQGRYPEARALFERALAVQRRQPADRSLLVAATLSGYGNTLKALGDFTAARAALEESLRIYEAAEGPDGAGVGRTLGNLGLVLQRLEDWDGAARAAERAAAILRREYGAESPRHAIALANLATVRSHQGRPREAVVLLREVMRIHEKSLGPAYPGEATLRNYLGWAWFDMGRLGEARAEFERAVAAAIREKGPSHTDAAWPLRGLAAVELAANHPEAARREYEKARALREKVYGPIHWEVAQSLDDLAQAAHQQGDLAAEEACLRQALAIRRQVHDRDHPQIAIAASRLGEVLCRRGDPTEGRALLSEAITLRTAAAGSEDAKLATWRRLLDACTAKG